MSTFQQTQNQQNYVSKVNCLEFQHVQFYAISYVHEILIKLSLK